MNPDTPIQNLDIFILGKSSKDYQNKVKTLQDNSFSRGCFEWVESGRMSEWRPRSKFVEDVLGVPEKEFRHSPELCRKALGAPRTIRNLRTGKQWDGGVLELPTLRGLRESSLVQHLQSPSLPESPGHLARLTSPRLCMPDTRSRVPGPRTRQAHQGTPELQVGTNFIDAAQGSGKGVLLVLYGAKDLSKVDVGHLQSLPENNGAVFQVASNFNALELMHKFDDRAMARVENYIFDRTQGPFASISCAPGLILRHYYPFYSEEAEPDDWRQKFGGRQIELLGDLEVDVRNGYLEITEDDFHQNIEAGRIRVAHHRDIQVAFGQVRGSDHEVVEHEQRVSQVFTATADLACTNMEFFQRFPDQMERVIKALLRAAYEGTLRAALSSGRRRVFLTLIGGGVFANPPSWIVDILEEQLELITESGLTVIVNTYRGIGEQAVFERLIALARKTGGDLIIV